jgi:PHS family inorganic phosphate transporter-like MFS transporter
VVAGIGFFTDAYDLFAVNLVTSMLGVVFWQNATHNPGKIPTTADTAIKVATSSGTVVGQVVFGMRSLSISWDTVANLRHRYSG